MKTSASKYEFGRCPAQTKAGNRCKNGLQQGAQLCNIHLRPGVGLESTNQSKQLEHLGELSDALDRADLAGDLPTKHEVVMRINAIASGEKLFVKPLGGDAGVIEVEADAAVQLRANLELLAHVDEDDDGNSDDDDLIGERMARTLGIEYDSGTTLAPLDCQFCGESSDSVRWYPMKGVFSCYSVCPSCTRVSVEDLEEL